MTKHGLMVIGAVFVAATALLVLERVLYRKPYVVMYALGKDEKKQNPEG